MESRHQERVVGSHPGVRNHSLDGLEHSVEHHVVLGIQDRSWHLVVGRVHQVAEGKTVVAVHQRHSRLVVGC